MSLTELAEAAGQSPATVYRVLQTLESHGIAEFQPAQQLWFVGREAFRIGSAFLGRSSLVEQARAVMRELMAETGETANLAIADGGQVVFLSQVETHEPIRAFFRPGTRGTIHASGIGKALLAYYPVERLDRIIRDQGLPAYTPHTITDRARLLDEMALTRARGWAIDDEERTEGMRCIAAPIFNEFREAVAGVSVSGPPSRPGEGRRLRRPRPRRRRPHHPRDRGADYGARVRAAADRITPRDRGATGTGVGRVYGLQAAFLCEEPHDRIYVVGVELEPEASSLERLQYPLFLSHHPNLRSCRLDDGFTRTSFLRPGPAIWTVALTRTGHSPRSDLSPPGPGTCHCSALTALPNPPAPCRPPARSAGCRGSRTPGPAPRCW
jgi:IclR family transcriptional regulator, acetate operon repressor